MDPEHIVLSTKLGLLRGSVQISVGVSEKPYYSFQGIPYAKPPVGDLRFEAPLPYGEWDGVLDAVKEGNDSLQKHILFRAPIGDEDCLFLNVYTPEHPKQEGGRKAVMVWIHGGGFTRGSGSSELYGPDYLVDEDVVLVTINYRCGVLGFLSLQNEKLPGNAGLKDQVLALHWVRDNIDDFGGDPDNVTIFGESAGAASVNYHLLSPLSRGLFHKAIMQSGVSTCQWAFQSKPREKAFLLANELGCISQDPDDVLEFLKSVPATDLMRTQDQEELTTNREKVHMLSLVFLPCVELEGNNPFLPDYPRKMMERGEFAKVPLIMGVNEKEGLIALEAKEVNIERVNENSSVMIPHNLDIPGASKDELKALGRDILLYYTNEETLTWDTVYGYLDFISDVCFTVPAVDARESFLKHQLHLYSYKFSYITRRAFSCFMIPMEYPDNGLPFVCSGASHGDELIHLFKANLPLVPYIVPTADDQVFMEKFLKAWTTFAKTGDPNCQELGLTWRPDDISHPHYLNMDKSFRTVDNIVFPDRIDFWKDVYEKYQHAF